jgi:hypothetical protein
VPFTNGLESQGESRGAVAYDIKTIEELPKLTEKTLGKRKKRDGEEEEGMWNKKLFLWELEYWPILDVHHSIDNMHVKKNVCEATCGTLLQQKSK